MSDESRIRELFTNHHTVDEIMPHMQYMTKKQVQAYLFNHFKRMRRIPKPWLPYEDGILKNNYKAEPIKLVPLFIDRTEHEIAERFIQLKNYAWLWPNQNRHTTDAVVVAAYMMQYCFPHKEITKRTGVEPSKFLSAHKILSRYIPEFKKRRPLHKYGRQMKQKEYVSPFA